MFKFAGATLVSALTFVSGSAVVHAAVPLLPTTPLVYSSVSANTARSGEVTLADPATSFYVYETSDYLFRESKVRGASVRLGGLASDTATLTQWDGTSTTMLANASTDFGVNRVRVRMDGRQAGDFYRSYGSIAPTPLYIDDYINTFDYSQYDYLYDPDQDRYVYAQSSFGATYTSVTPSATFRSNYIANFDYGNYDYVEDVNSGFFVYKSNLFGHSYDPVSNDLVFDTPGVLEANPSGGGDFFFVPNADSLQFNSAGVVAPSPFDPSSGYFVPNQPEVEIDLRASRSVQAYSRWEDIFYFAPRAGAPAGSGGIATLTVLVDGTLHAPNWAGSLNFYARDWENKDSFGSYLATYFANAEPGTSVVNEFITIDVPFLYGQPQYVKAEVSAYLYGEGEIEFGNTVSIVEIAVPEDTAVFSYASYLFGTPLGFGVSGGLDGGSLPGGYAGFFAGGGGGTPIPLPAPLYLLATAALLLRRCRH